VISNPRMISPPQTPPVSPNLMTSAAWAATRSRKSSTADSSDTDYFQPFNENVKKKHSCRFNTRVERMLIIDQDSDSDNEASFMTPKSSRKGSGGSVGVCYTETVRIKFADDDDGSDQASKFSWEVEHDGSQKFSNSILFDSPDDDGLDDLWWDSTGIYIDEDDSNDQNDDEEEATGWNEPGTLLNGIKKVGDFVGDAVGMVNWFTGGKLLGKAGW